MKKNLLILVLCAGFFSVETFGQVGPAGNRNILTDNEAIAAKATAMEVDGLLNEPSWNIDQSVSKIVNGIPGEDQNIILFGLTYDTSYLYIGIDLTDNIITPFEMGEVFIDGNNNGGAYGETDLHLRFAGIYVQVIYPDSITGLLLGFAPKLAGDGYTAELGIPWSELGITPVAGDQIGFDLIFSDGDSGAGVDYVMAWNGDLQNYEETTFFGDLLFRPEKYIVATSVISMLVDGNHNDAGWEIIHPISNVVSGTVGIDSNEVYFGLAYNAEYLYIGLDGNDSLLTLAEMGEVFIDGNNNDGTFDEYDLHLRFAGPDLFILYPDTIMGVLFGFSPKPLFNGYLAELAIPWSELGVTPSEGGLFGFDVIIGDSDTGSGIDYMMAWNGTLLDSLYTTLFGNVIFGESSGVNDMVDVSEKIDIYPNPSYGQVYLDMQDAPFDGSVTVDVADITGRAVHHAIYNPETERMIGIDASHFTTGLYFITISDNTGSKAVKKLIVE
jgi:hypothetical protein